ncbi:VOC family protein [Demequina soli]|uniref:VOC family protein n=1 Tax=Demequina soli TaxID=1638987 RepID=UPI0007849FF4|nr:VOC family protein [Demequina soli]
MSTAVTVMLIVPDAAAAVRWYAQAFGAAPRWDLGGVALLEIAGAPFLVHETVPGKERETDPLAAGTTTARIELLVDDPDVVLARAAAAGASALTPVSEHAMPWGPHRQGGLTDLFGHRWSVGDRSPLEASDA